MKNLKSHAVNQEILEMVNNPEAVEKLKKETRTKEIILFAAVALLLGTVIFLSATNGVN